MTSASCLCTGPMAQKIGWVMPQETVLKGILYNCMLVPVEGCSQKGVIFRGLDFWGFSIDLDLFSGFYISWNSFWGGMNSETPKYAQLPVQHQHNKHVL